MSKVRAGSHFLVIGPKGCGKSAILEKICKDSIDSDFSFYASPHILGDIPHNLLKKIVPGQESAEISLRRGWKYICYVLLYRSLSSDPHFQTDGALPKEDLDFLLARTGLMTAESLSDIITKSKESKLRAATRNLGAERTTLQDFEDINHDTLYETIRDHVWFGKTPRMHFILLDGLDRIFSASPGLKQSLAALIGAVFDVNMELLDHDIPARVVALVRNDTLEEMATPDLAKFVGDHGIPVEWFDSRMDPTNTPLWELIDRRASVSLKRPTSIYKEYLPPEMRNGEHPVKFLLDRTRHRPRDLIEFLNYVREATRGEKPTSDDLDSGYSRYSEKYLLPEVIDELKGFLTQDESTAAIDLLRMLNKPRFTSAEVVGTIQAHPHLRGLHAHKVLSALFNCSAIGHIGEGPGFEQFRFKYRNETWRFTSTHEIVVHKGLQRALHMR